MTVELESQYLEALALLDTEIRLLGNRKIMVLFEALDIRPGATELAKIMAWDLIAVSVPDRKMALQLNKLLPYVANIIFVVNEDDALFTLRPGVKKRRVRKDR